MPVFNPLPSTKDYNQTLSIFRAALSKLNYTLPEPNHTLPKPNRPLLKTALSKPNSPLPEQNNYMEPTPTYIYTLGSTASILEHLGRVFFFFPFFFFGSTYFTGSMAEVHICNHLNFL